MYLPYKRLIPDDLNMKRVFVFSGLGFILAFALIFISRAIFLEDHTVHYHANFALYINEEQDKFENPLFYEEVQTCSTQNDDNPNHRVHMHDNKNHIVHVHDGGVTWAHFFANLGYGLTDKSIETDEGVFVDGEDGKNLTFLINGQEVQSIANRVIKSEDTLLIDYGEGKNIEEKFNKIPEDADEHNTKPDPAACSGSGLSTEDRMLKILKFWQ